MRSTPAKSLILAGLLATISSASMPASLWAAPQPRDDKPFADPTGIEGPLASRPVVPNLTVALRDLPDAKLSEGSGVVADDREPPPFQRPRIGWGADQKARDPLAGRGRCASCTRTPSTTLSVDGLGNDCSCYPPDPIGAVGPNDYVQMVNATTLDIYDKSTGTPKIPAKDITMLFGSGNCAASHDGDPVVVYDSIADRWVLAQFSTGRGVCVAVSTSPDPAGTYNGYEFTTPSLPDYFKIGAWPNAYYMGANESSYSALALDRAKMLAGQPATFVRFAGETNFLMPATVDGPTPPADNADGLFYTFKDDSFHGGGADRLELFAFHPDFTTPANSTFSLLQTLSISSFTYTVCGFFTKSCIPQAGTARKIDAVSEWPMWRLAYRNFGSHESLVANFTVKIATSQGGIRWYELRNSGTGWGVQQEGTWSPDSSSRFMGSIAMDNDGDIALAYTTSSSSVHPEARYTVRLATDPDGVLQTEQTMVAAGGSQTGASRWGDYSALTIDPADGCTFWYTSEYYPANALTAWHTRIGSFKIPTCETRDTPTPAPTGTSTQTRTPTVTPTPTETATATLTATETDTATRSPTVTSTPSPTPLSLGLRPTAGGLPWLAILLGGMGLVVLTQRARRRQASDES